MKVKLNDIKPSPRPIRSKWDEEAMEELKTSIAEQGLIVPIKVRPLDGKYEIVYGHRRVEAIRRLGWNECEAMVEGMEPDDALVQSLIENIQREDLSPMDKARGLKELQECKGWSLKDLERRGIMSRVTAGELVALLGEPEELTRDLEFRHGGVPEEEGPLPLAPYHVREIRRAFPDDKEMKLALAEKVRRERLTSDQLKTVARAIKATPDRATRKAILEKPIVPTPRKLIEEVEVEAIVERLETKEKEEKERAWWREHPSTKEFLDLLKMYLRLIRRAWESVIKEKIPPEHCNYLAGFIEDKVIGLLQEIVSGLREKAKKWQ